MPAQLLVLDGVALKDPGDLLAFERVVHDALRLHVGGLLAGPLCAELVHRLDQSVQADHHIGVHGQIGLAQGCVGASNGLLTLDQRHRVVLSLCLVQRVGLEPTTNPL